MYVMCCKAPKCFIYLTIEVWLLYPGVCHVQINRVILGFELVNNAALIHDDTIIEHFLSLSVNSNLGNQFLTTYDVHGRLPWVSEIYRWKWPASRNMFYLFHLHVLPLLYFLCT